jgi:tRNA(Ile)-lysidine synthase
MTYFLGYSGGLDSHCLLHMCANDPLYKNKLCAVYIHHGLSSNADAWQAHCAQTCAQLNIPFKAIKVKVERMPGKSLEACARAARYAAFAELVQEGDVLLTAHHQDDQAETLLLQLLRGAGVKGLAAMPLDKPFAKGRQYRPLLQMTRAELEAYAEQHVLSWIEDESNQSLAFDRNFLRHEIMPVLKARWPSACATLARSSENCADAAALIEDLARIDLIQVQANDNTLSIPALMQLSTPRRFNLLRYWLQQEGCSVPEAQQLKRIVSELIAAKIDAQPLIEWEGGAVRRFQEHLYADATIIHSVPADCAWEWKHPITIGTTTLSTIKTIGEGLDPSKLPATLTVKFRQGGERIKLPNRDGTHTLKNLLQEWQVPPWLRDTIPLIYAGEQLIAVVNYCYAADYTVAKTQQGISIRGAQ